MAADATDILNAVAGALTAAFPAVRVVVRKGQPGPTPESPLAGLGPADGLPAFVLSCAGPEPTETSPSFEHVSVGYPVDIAYVKDAEADPGRDVEDPDIREKRAAVRDLLYRPRLSGAARVFHTKYAAGRVYRAAENDVTRVVSEQTLTPVVVEARGGTA